MPPRESILANLRAHAAELHAVGLTHLRLFGSIARNDASSGSDIDLLADFDASARISLLTISRLQIRLTEILGAPVDLSAAVWLKDPIRDRVLEESIHVF
jgi:hypothetical protein